MDKQRHASRALRSARAAIVGLVLAAAPGMLRAAGPCVLPVTPPRVDAGLVPGQTYTIQTCFCISPRPNNPIINQLVFVPALPCVLGVSSNPPSVSGLDVTDGATVCVEETITLPINVDPNPRLYKCALRAIADGVPLAEQSINVNLVQPRVESTKKGSLLIFPNVEVKWAADGEVIQDTFIELTNDHPQPVHVHAYFVNGDRPLPQEPGWNWLDNGLELTGDQPVWWSAWSGQPHGVTPWEALDPGVPPGRPDPDGPARRALRGFVYVWAVDEQDAQIRWNHLTGKALIVNYALGSAAEYTAYAAQSPGGQHGERVGAPGALQLDGIHYDYAYDRLIMQFYTAGALALSGGGHVVGVDTDLSLHPVSVDFRQEGVGIIRTKARFDIWNENEVRFSNMEFCVNCWDQALFSHIPSIPNHLTFQSLQTSHGKARIDGVGSSICPGSIAVPLLGVTVEELAFDGGQTHETASSTLAGQGVEQAIIRYDVVRPPQELRPRAGWMGPVTGQPEMMRLRK